MSRVDLTYELDMETRLYNGRYSVTEGNETITGFFRERTFSQMMSRLAKHVRESDECEVFLHRKEVSGTYAMSPAEVQQLREDPAAAISSMQVPDRTVVVRDRPDTMIIRKEDELKEEPTFDRYKPITISLRAGHDTLADAFGDEVYVRRREYKIEDPLSGRWSWLSRAVRKRDEDPEPYCRIYDRDGERLELFGFEAGDGWFRVRTTDLLGLSAPRYFLPRRWNKSGPWISHGELKQMYETYLKEKDDVTDGANRSNGSCRSTDTG